MKLVKNIDDITITQLSDLLIKRQALLLAGKDPRENSDFVSSINDIFAGITDEEETD